MDIVTHAGIGVIAASPFLASRPELALGLVAGSVTPDLDALCRLISKRAFLRAHQTWSHALPVSVAASLVAGVVASWRGWNGVELGAGLLAGLIGHSLLDTSNTFGVAWLSPFSRRRFCFGSVFFIDAVVLAAIAVSLSLVAPIWLRNKEVPISYAATSLVFLLGYFPAKGALRRRAAKFFPGATSLVPSALVPWRFFATERKPGSIARFRVNALTGARAPLAEASVLDESFAGLLAVLPEFRLMREVSPEYHVVHAAPDGSGTLLLCRDMRLRNFGTRFGDLEVWLDAKQEIVRTRFYA